MAESSEFMRASDSHGHSSRMQVRFPSDVADRMYTLLHEDRGLTYRNTHDAVRDWVLDGMEKMAEQQQDPELSRAVNAFVMSQRMQIKMEQYEAERELIERVDALLHKRIPVPEDELLSSLASIRNEDNAEDFRRVLISGGFRNLI